VLRPIGGLLQWPKVWQLYRSAFPRDERKPFRTMVKLWRAGKSDIWCILDGGEFAGFASTLNDRDVIMIDYLAVAPHLRGKRIGSQALRDLQKAYPDRGIFVEIESIYDDTPDRQDRARRKAFYAANGFEPMNVLADVFGVPMELMGWRCAFDYNRYYRFYYDNYSPAAASHLQPMIHPEQ